jgi:hypothetical protein
VHFLQPIAGNRVVMLAAIAVAASSQQEEAAVVRMLTMTHKLMAGDQPLPTSAVAAVSVAGEPGAAVSSWAAQLAATSSAPVGPHSRAAHEFSNAFRAVAGALAQGRFGGLREALQASCQRAKALAQAAASGQSASQRNATFGPDELPVLLAWVQDCSTLAQYTPAEPPALEDHKRLLLLLHDLGAPLLIFALLGKLPEALVGVGVMAELAAAIMQFGGADRRAMLCHAMPCHAMPCYAMPCHAMLCYAMVGARPSPSGSSLRRRTPTRARRRSRRSRRTGTARRAARPTRTPTCGPRRRS